MYYKILKKKKDLIWIVDIFIKNVCISVISNVLWNNIKKLNRINKNFVCFSVVPIPGEYKKYLLINKS